MCVDEVHCLSSWSHNFRPSYLRLGKALAQLQVPVMGLTATATTQVVQDVCSSLSLDFNPSKNRKSWYRANLQIEIVEMEDDDDARIKRVSRLLGKQSKEAKLSKGSVIIYTSTKYEATVLADRLMLEGIERVKPYHAGLPPNVRRKVQEDFMRGKVRVMVATVAFGMGLDKHNVRGVIHYRVPSSLENYIQEIGRAGRDNEEAYCVCFLSRVDARRTKSLSYSDGVSKWQIRQVLDHVLKGTCLEGSQQDMTRGNTVSSPLPSLGTNPQDYSQPAIPNKTHYISVLAKQKGLLWDLRESVIETLLVRLEQLGCLSLLPSGYATVTLDLSGQGHMSKPLAIALQKCGKEGSYLLVDLANAMELSPEATIRELCLGKEGRAFKMELKDPCLFVRPLNHACTLEGLVDVLHAQAQAMEASLLAKVQAVYSTLSLFDPLQTSLLERAISNYLKGEVVQEVALFEDVPNEVLCKGDAKRTLSQVSRLYPFKDKVSL